MSSGTLTVAYRSDYWLSIASVTILGFGSVIAIGFAMREDWTIATIGAVMACAALIVLLAADWVPPLLVIAVSLPLPALVSGEAIRISPAAIATAAVILAWSISPSTASSRSTIRIIPCIPVCLLLAAVGISAIFAQNALAAMRELINWCLMLGLLVVAVNSLSEKPARAPMLVSVMAAIAGITGACAVMQMLGVLPGSFPLSRTGLNRANLGFEHPNELAMFLAIMLPLCVYVSEVAGTLAKRALAMCGLAACSLGLIATFSRGSWLAIALSAVIIFALGERKFVLRFAFAAAAIVMVGDFASGGALTARVIATPQDGLVLQRLALTYTGLLMFRANPIVGVGPGGFGGALEQFGPQVGVLREYVGSAHNGYIHMAAETGVLGLVALLLFIVAAFRILWNSFQARKNDSGVDPQRPHLQRAMLWSFTVFSLVSFFEWPFAHGIGQLAILVLAIGFASGNSMKTLRHAGTADHDANADHVRHLRKSFA